MTPGAVAGARDPGDRPDLSWIEDKSGPTPGSCSAARSSAAGSVAVVEVRCVVRELCAHPSSTHLSRAVVRSPEPKTAHLTGPKPVPWRAPCPGGRRCPGGRLARAGDPVPADGPIKLAEMAATLGVTPSTALRMAERLEGLGLTDRRVNPDNRREVVLRLTPAGEELVDRVLSHRRAEIRSLVERLPAAQRAGLVPALTALTTAAAGLDPALAPAAEAGHVAGVVDDPLNPAP
nr:MarR family winged helix-turn-helix transcriptional regulator [Streptomyces sp. CoH27]